MRMVRITIEYDMDDPDKILGDELLDWLSGNVGLQDLVNLGFQWVTPTTVMFGNDTVNTIRINELDSQGEVK